MANPTELFLRIIKDCEQKNVGGSIILGTNRTCLMAFHEGCAYLNYDKIWNALETESGLVDREIKDLIKHLFANTFAIKLDHVFFIPPKKQEELNKHF